MAKDVSEQRAEDLIRQIIPANSEERVRNAAKRFAPFVREIIRSETALRLVDSESRGSLPVRVVKGVPSELVEVIAKRPDPLLWRLLSLKGQFRETHKTLSALHELLPLIDSWNDAPRGLRDLLPSIEPTRDALEILASLKRLDEIKGEITQIFEDILGRYFYPAFAAPHIELYWMPIAFFAQMIGVAIEDLTIVVLTHELAHGYTHIGKDIDGEFWDQKVFALTSKEVKEGLAQYYTEVGTKKLGSRAPGAHAAYTEFLKLQSGPYTVHTKWLEDQPERKGEAIRFALLAGRRANPMEHVDWLKLLERISNQLRNGTSGSMLVGRLKLSKQTELLPENR